MDRTQTPPRPLSDLVDFLRTAHGVTANEGPEPGRVVAEANGRTVAEALDVVTRPTEARTRPSP